MMASSRISSEAADCANKLASSAMASQPGPPPLRVVVLRAWRGVAHYIALGHAGEFVGRSKEGLVFRRLKMKIERERVAPVVCTDLQVPAPVPPRHSSRFR